MIRYFCWHVYKKLHDKISLGFMLAGHTKFTPDRCFGIIKKSYRSRFVSSLYDIAEAIEESSEIGTNLVQIVEQDGTIVVPVFDWSKFFNGVFILSLDCLNIIIFECILQNQE